MWGKCRLPKTTLLPVNPSLPALPLPPALPVRNSRMINEAVCFDRGKCSEQHLVYSSRTRYVYRCWCFPHSLQNSEGGGGLPARLWCLSLLGNLMDPKKTKKQQSCTCECSRSGRKCRSSKEKCHKAWRRLTLSPRSPFGPTGPCVPGDPGLPWADSES